MNVNQFDIEWELCEALDHAVPDVKDEILRRCAEEHFSEDRIVPMDLDSRPKKKRIHWQSYTAVAAIVLLVINIGVGLVRDRAQNRVETIISLDVNPSIELSVNAQDRVVAVTAINADANIVLSGMNLTGSTTNVAVNAILGSMYKQGYLGVSSNSILVSVDNKNEEVSREIETRLIEDINETLQSYSLEAAILSQTVSSADDTVSQTATNYEMSQGRTILIQKIIDNNPYYTFEELSQLTINELNLLLNSQNIEVQTVTVVGVASEGYYIGQDAAAETVLSQFTGSRDALKDLYVDIGVLNARMVYEVSYLYEGVIYIYGVDALTGEIVASSVDYPVTDVSPTTDITVSAGGGETNGNAGSAGGKEDEETSSGSVVSGNQISGNETGSDVVSENGSEGTSDTEQDEKEGSGNASNVGQRPAVSGNSVSGNSVSGNSVSGNGVSGDEAKDVNENLLEGKYSAVFMKRSGIPKGADLLWKESMDGEEDFGEYDEAWITVEKAYSTVLSHAQITQNNVKYTLTAVYEQEGEIYLILEFETRTAAYQYILDALEGTIVEYEKRRL
ncbi:MAG: hypothetical protein K2K20_03170 [Lachnospiraceae bacterium]|nr:hypothetical protein [Lachnospiraceae bacterium]